MPDRSHGHQPGAVSTRAASDVVMLERIEYCRGRHAGVLLPLSSCPSTRSWGIGEIADLPIVARWLREAGLDLILMLPVNEMAFGQNSPYSALSAMAIDPLYIALADVPEFQALGGEAALSSDLRAQLDAVRRSPSVAYADVHRLKDEALRASYARFDEDRRTRRTDPRVRARTDAFEAFCAASAWWLSDYALFRALHEAHDHRAWWTWDRAVQERDDAALGRARLTHAHEIRYYEFLQWLAAEQWQAARLSSSPVGFFGDLPFMVGADSADVWAHQDLFARDLSVGTPPDAFSATGQDWGLPAYRWDFMRVADFRWLRDRARRARELFDGFRIDHVIGFYRTYVRPIALPGASDHPAVGGDGGAPARAPFFTPADEHEQRALGEHILRLFQESGACIIAEDLGTVPDFVRESLGRLQVPGYRVLRWEREWNQPGQPFRHPAHYPARSLATTGTHDTDPLAIWWETAPADERREVAKLAGLPVNAAADHPAFDRSGGHDSADSASAVFDPRVRDAILRLLYASGSDLLVLPMQDLFGWPDRINTPATIGDTNWTWRLPWPVDRLDAEPEAHDRATTLRRWSQETERSLTLTR